MRRLERYPVTGKNSMQFWPRVVSPWRMVKNFVVIEIGRYIPVLSWKNSLYRRFLGLDIGSDASIGLMVMLDIFHPDYISIGAGSIIGYNTTILCHEFLPREYRLGRVSIGQGVLVGANCTILPGVSIGDGAVVAAHSLVNRDIPPHTLAGGVPARVIRPQEDP
ncbi:MAG: acyltransferase [Clostridia bacterium]|nr:MAG: acyltransferase [Clostridia bacterium]